MLERMPDTSSILRSCVTDVTEAIAETLWPTRCAVCDAPGDVLCGKCRRDLPYIDWWRACPRCGAPFGRVQCTECNPVVLTRLERERLPHDGCASAVAFDEGPARIVRTYKDHGERRLADDIARIMTQTVPPAWPIDMITFVPASAAAVRRRGFDHAELLSTKLAHLLNAPCTATLARPRTRDQRSLSRRGRLQNTAGRFSTIPGSSPPRRLLLVDDVHTTGATLFDATDALKRAGAHEVRCLTFARV